MALAENLHHSRQKVEGGKHEGSPAQKTAKATGARPGILEEPEPQGGAVTDGYVAAPLPSLAVPLLAGAAGEGVDSSSLRFLTAAALRQREEEEEGAGESEGEEEGAREGASAAGKGAVVQGVGGQEEEEEEEEEADASYVLSLSSRTRSSSTAAVACSQCWLFLFSLCSL